MTYFLKRFKPTEKYSLEKFASVSPQSEGDTHKVGDDYNEAKGKQKEANEAIKAGNLTPLGEWREGISATSEEIEE